MTEAQNKRITNFEILRTVSMALIIVVHILGTGTSHNPAATDLTTFDNGFWLNSALYPILYAVGTYGVILFVLISGYFISESNEIRVDRLAKVWFPTLFYSVLFATVFYVLRKTSTKQFLLSFFPIGSEQYWFVTKYFALVLLAPLLSFIVKGLNKKNFQIALIVLMLLIVNITHGIPYGLQFFKDSPFSVASFVLIFFIAAYIKKYDVPEKIKKHSGWIALAFLILQGALGILVNVLSPADEIIHGGFGSHYNSLSLIPATCIFIWFKEHHFCDNLFNKFLVHIAPYMFGVYLIHENMYFQKVLWVDIINLGVYLIHENMYFQKVLWVNIINPSSWWQSPYWIILVLTGTITILVSGTVIDYFRNSLFKVCRIDKLTAYCKKFNVNL